MALFPPSVVNFEAIREAKRGQSLANILAVGTATPSNCFYQDDYPDYYFRITNNEHMIALKKKFKRICDKTMIKKRYMHLTEEFLKENPNMCEYMAPSLNARQDLLVTQVPKLGKDAATKAIDEWGFPISKITHLIFCTSAGVDTPGADYQLAKLLGLSPSVNRLMMYQQGCSAGGTALRLAKDIAENNKVARVLIVCSETNAAFFHGPNENDITNLVSQSLFGDGAAAIIVGSDPDLLMERSLFEIVSANQMILPNTGNAINLHLREEGLMINMYKDVPKLLTNNIEEVLIHALCPLGISDWNSLFWIVHPGGRAILDQMELKLKLKKEKLRASRHVLSEYGNMSSTSVFFIMDEMRKKSMEEGKITTGEGLDLGVFIAFGPGITTETVVLRSLPGTT